MSPITPLAPSKKRQSETEEELSLYKRHKNPITWDTVAKTAQESLRKLNDLETALNHKVGTLNKRLLAIQEKLPNFPRAPFETKGFTLPPMRDRYLFSSNTHFFSSVKQLQKDILIQMRKQRSLSSFVPSSLELEELQNEESTLIGSCSLKGYNGTEQKENSHDHFCFFSINTLVAGEEIPLQVFAVFDGHGSHGNHVSAYAQTFLKPFLEESFHAINRSGEEYEIANSLIYCTMLIDSGYRSYQKKYLPQDIFSGSTSTIVLLTPDKIFTACLGDSRAALVKKGLNTHQQLTFDQSANDPTAQKDAFSRAFIRKAHGTYRIESTNVTGALGNYHTIMPRKSNLKMLHIQPRVNVVSRTEEDAFLVLSSDGLYFSELSPSTMQVGNFLCQNNLSPAQGAKQLAKAARNSGSLDDITVIVADLSVSYNDLGSYMSGLEREQEKSNILSTAVDTEDGLKASENDSKQEL